ncbi:hypothetical protein ccbrp13_41140 [Ktedonobacteria bacterium brp13]|nr:hypothetical protein ccbrp13_41140 [Ktedonobacteria bacterium brp13]
MRYYPCYTTSIAGQCMQDILPSYKAKNFSYLAQILGPTLAWERSADAPDLT